MASRALEAAETLAGEGDRGRSDRPALACARSTWPTIVASVKKTSRLMCVYEGVKTLGIGAEISAAIAESEAFDYLDAPILRLGGAEAPIPYSPVLEKAAVPQVDDIRRGRAQAGGRAGLTWRSRSSCRASTWTWRRARSRAGSSARARRVAKGQPLFEIETDKAAMEIEAPADGVLRGVAGAARRDVAGRRGGRLDLRAGRSLRGGRGRSRRGRRSRAAAAGGRARRPPRAGSRASAGWIFP